MKKISIFFIALLSLGLTTSSCSDDENTSIVGKWIFSQEGFAVEGGQEVLVPYQHTSGCNQDYVEFTAEGVVKNENYFNEGAGCESDLSMGTYLKSDNNLTLTIDGETVNATIITLNSSTLKIKVTVVEGAETVSYITVFSR